MPSRTAPSLPPVDSWPPRRRPWRSAPTLTRDVAPGVHRLEHAFVNCYLVEASDGRGVTLVDSALPRTWPALTQALTGIGRTSADVEALVLTHAHFDHLGTARRLATDWGLPVRAHPDEHEIARHPYRYAHENPRAIYPLRHPRGASILAAMTRAGALTVRGVDIAPMEAGSTLSVPGRPHVVFSPGHTFGHCALHLPDRDAILTGDALVTLDPYTGHRGPRIVAGAATADSALALRSLDALADTDAEIVLPGHGDPWRGGIRAAAAYARRVGRS